MIRKATFCLMLTLVAGSTAWTMIVASVGSAGTTQDAFTCANKLYRDGKYTQAVSAYQKILAEGIASPSLFYNLGNAYAKAGEVGKAVLAYERALREDPRDPETRANLQYVRSLLSDKTEEGGLQAVLGQIAPGQWLSYRENVWGFAVFYWFGAIVSVAGILLRRRWKGVLVGSFVLLGIALLLGTVLFFRSPLWADPKAIVLAKEVEVRYGPVLGESAAFTLHEGSMVRILRTEKDWDQILFAKGKVGWVTADSLEKI